MVEINTNQKNLKSNNKMKKLFFIIPTLTQGGAERVIVTLIKYLDRSKFRITIMVVDMSEEVYKKEIPSDVKIIDLNSKRVRKAIPKIISNLWHHRPQIVMSTLGHLNIAIALFRILMPKNIRFIARETIVVTEKIKRSKHKKLWKFLYRFYYPTFDKIICQSRDMLDDLSSIIGVNKNLVLINNPVDHEGIKSLINIKDPIVERFFCDKSYIYFVAAGRLIKQKGFELLIEAISLTNNPKIRLAILGHGPLEKRLNSLIEYHNLEEQIILTGYQKNPYLWFSKADAFILSSYYEGFPNVVLESLSCGTPVISTPAPGGTKEILEPIEGCYLSNKITAGSLKKAISEFINSGRHRIKNDKISPFKSERICQEYTNIFLGKK